MSQPVAAPANDASLLGATLPGFVVSVFVDDIEVKGLIRRPRAARVAAILAEMRAEGQKTPIEISPSRFVDGRQLYHLTKGWVRLEAARQAGSLTIIAKIRRATAAERRQREIDDNLIDGGCTVLDRARYLACGKLIYEGKHPETRHGLAGKSELPNLATPRFTAYAAARYGVIERSVQRATAIGERLDPATSDLLAETDWADHQAALEAISRQEPAVQLAVAEILTRETDPISTVAEALAMVVGAAPPDSSKKAWSAALGGWGRLGAIERRNFLREVSTNLPTGVRIVFDGDGEDA